MVAIAVCALALAGRFQVSSAASQTHSGLNLDGVLRSLDRDAKNFRSLSADVERTKVTVVVNDKSTETGSIL
ncbi:MAG: hypothetical protein WA886_07470, partial [Candidatus Acidiferrales bacterium]